MRQERDAALTSVASGQVISLPTSQIIVAATAWPQLPTLATQLSVTPAAILATTFAALLQRYTLNDAVQLGVTTGDAELITLHFAGDADQSFAASVRDVQAQLQASVSPNGVGSPEAAAHLATLHLTQAAEGWQVRLTHYPERVSLPEAERVTRHFTRLLRVLLADPNQLVAEASLLDPASPDADEHAEWQQVVVDWNATASTYPRDASMAAVFTAQAQATPDAIAVVSGGAHLSYGALLARASQLAHHLRSLGVGPDVPVGLCLDRSPDLIPALLAIMLAGGAYVPLDPSYPPARLAHLMRDAQVPLVLTQAHLHAPLSEAEVPLLDVARLWPQIAALPTTPPIVGGTAEHLAYLCYTSGSTGQPKGVAIIQRGVLRMTLGADYATFGPNETYMQFAPLAFDAATLEIWGPLLTGGRLVVAPAGLVPLDVLGDLILREGITTLW
ncbi:MAG: AMP-binding protein, partial [Ktedonobacterales bacterium]|nr:AMP-binding protein [Ktedonobacterales bacterium]